MTNSVVNVSGYDASYGIDAFLVDTDYRQIVTVGGNTSAVGGTATVDSSALYVSAVGGTVGVSNLNEVSSVQVNNLNEVSSVQVTNLNEVSSVQVNNLNEVSSLQVTNLNEVSSLQVNNLNEVSSISINNTVVVSGVYPNLIDSNNSTSTPLAGGATYTGTATDVSEYTVVTVMVTADQDSAAGGLKIQQSTDGTNWDESHDFDLVADVTRRYQFPVVAQYFRVVLVNGGSSQGYLRLQTIAHRENTLYSIHQVEDTTETGDRTCQLVKAVLQAKKPGGDYANIDCTTGGNLKVSLEEVDGGAEVPVHLIGTNVSALVEPSKDAYLSHVYLDYDAAGSNPTTNTEVVAAPGAGNRLVVYGIQGSMAAAGASDFGLWRLSDGNTSDSTTVWVGRAQGTDSDHFSLTFPYGVSLTANTALKITSVEGSGNIFLNAVVYYRTETV